MTKKQQNLELLDQSTGWSVTNMIDVIGDSMAPTLRPGDQVCFDTSDQSISQPGIFVLLNGDNMVIKRVERVLNSNPPMVRLISDNTMYEPYEIPERALQVVGRATFFGRRM
jgi:phage repressor protein C with HTH and peptisase S24 domain